MKRRQGTCNQCGDCCGSNGDSPFPKFGFARYAGWEINEVLEHNPLMAFFGLGMVGDSLGVEDLEGNYRIGPTRFYFAWRDAYGKGIIPCKDTSAAHDGSTYSVECPFLLPDPGDGSRPCGLVGTNDDGARQKYCRPEERPDYNPINDLWRDKFAAQWQEDHPNCSYTWEDVTE